jgi:sphinganine-1-phosphate aldolase
VNDGVLARLRELRAGDVPTHGGSTMAYVYDSGVEGLDELAAAAQAEYQWTNALDPTAFPSVAALENDVVAFAAGLLGGGPDTAGTVTSGGTESCLLAVLAARERTGGRRLLLPVTAHAAFRKAAHLFGLTVVDLPVDPVTCAVVPATVRRALTPDTALVVVSAPSYPHGVLDPVAPVAALAAARGVPCHVDACVGGWVLPFLRSAGEDVPPFDLSVPGVSSLSVDLHKYGYAPKGVSVLLTRDAELRRAHYFVTAGWPGYPVVNPTLAGTRPAGPLAAAWAVIQALGPDGYERLAVAARRATLELAAGVEALPGLRVVGEPASTLLAFASSAGGPDVLVVADEMRARGWVLQPQPAHGGLPPTVHLTVTAATAARVPALLADLAAATEVAATLPSATPDPALVAAAHQVDVAALTPEVVTGLLELAGLGRDGSLPARMAPVHALLGVLPAALTERLLAEVIGRVYTP